MIRLNRLVLIVTVTVACALGIYFLYPPTQKSHRITIGILQTGTHPALDTVRESFKQVVQEKLGQPVTFIVRNAQADVSRAHAAAQYLHTQRDAVAFLTIGTLASQSMASVEHERPIVVTAVSYPETLLSPATSNICGVSDRVPMKEEIEALTQLLPLVRHVGILYNPAEANAVRQIEEMSAELDSRGITNIKVGVSCEADLAAATITTLQKVDALIAPTDNTIAAASPVVIALAKREGKPFIACHNEPVHIGALMARGVDYHDNGVQAADCVKQLLIAGKKPVDLPIRPPRSGTIAINRQVLAELHLEVPASLLALVTFVDSKTCSIPKGSL